MADHLSSLQAYVIGTQGGRPVRRDAWRRWIRWSGGTAIAFSWWLNDDLTETLHVVLNTELTVADLAAEDWTDEAWPGATVFPPGVCCTPIAQAAVPVPVADPEAATFCSCDAPAAAPAGGSMGGASGGTSGGVTISVGGSTLTFTFLGAGNFGSPANPPDANSAGGGGAGPVIPPTIVWTESPPSGGTPVVTVRVIPPTGAEFFAVDGRFDTTTGTFTPVADTDTPLVLPALDFHVSTAGGAVGISVISYTVGGGTAPMNDNGFNGFSQDREGTSISFLPGGTITITATYLGVVGSATYTFPRWGGVVDPTTLTSHDESTVGSTISGTFTANGSTTTGAPTGTLTISCPGKTSIVQTGFGPGGSRTYTFTGVTTPITVSASYVWQGRTITASHNFT